jgi:hypothetical protein
MSCIVSEIDMSILLFIFDANTCHIIDLMHRQFHNDSKKSTFAILWIFYDLLRISKDSARFKWKNRKRKGKHFPLESLNFLVNDEAQIWKTTLSGSLHQEPCKEFLFAYGSFFFIGTETEQSVRLGRWGDGSARARPSARTHGGAQRGRRPAVVPRPRVQAATATAWLRVWGPHLRTTSNRARSAWWRTRRWSCGRGGLAWEAAAATLHGRDGDGDGAARLRTRGWAKEEMRRILCSPIWICNSVRGRRRERGWIRYLIT